jgi:hypothetical protein
MGIFFRLPFFVKIGDFDLFLFLIGNFPFLNAAEPQTWITGANCALTSSFGLTL